MDAVQSGTIHLSRMDQASGEAATYSVRVAKGERLRVTETAGVIDPDLRRANGQAVVPVVTRFAPPASTSASPSPSPSASASASASVGRNTSSAPPPVRRPEPQTIFNNWNKGGVGNSPIAPTVFAIDTPLFVTYLNTYHYNFGRGARAGTIALRHEDGTVYGPWQSQGLLSSGAPDGTWEVRPNVVIKPGRYTVIDSNPNTWSQNAESRGRGFVDLRGSLEPIRR